MAVTTTELRLIFTTDLTDAQLTAFIAAAGVLIGTDGCDLAGAGLSATTIKEIEKWLSAHLATSDDFRVESHRSSGHQVTFESEIGLGLDQSRYGQMAKRMDRTGCLAQIDKAGRTKLIARAARASPTSAFRERQI